MSVISVVINTLNEEKNIRNCIESAKKIADEIVVVDMHSDDNTVNIARDLGAKIFTFERMGYVEPARNYAIEKCSGDWILILDADERVPHTLAQEMKNISTYPDSADFYRLPRKNIIFDKWIKHSRWWPDYNIRFFKKGSVVWSELIHSVPETKGVGLDIPAEEKLSLVHHHYCSVEQYIERLNRYTTQNAKELNDKGYVFDWKDLLKKPAEEFFSRFFAGDGYRDGIHGLALAGLQSFSEFIVYLKTWQSGGFSQKSAKVGNVIDEISSIQKDINYWKADTIMKVQGGLINRIRRKYKI